MWRFRDDPGLALTNFGLMAIRRLSRPARHRNPFRGFCPPISPDAGAAAAGPGCGLASLSPLCRADDGASDPSADRQARHSPWLDDPWAIRRTSWPEAVTWPRPAPLPDRRSSARSLSWASPCRSCRRDQVALRIQPTLRVKSLPSGCAPDRQEPSPTAYGHMGWRQNGCALFRRRGPAPVSPARAAGRRATGAPNGRGRGGTPC